MPPEYVERDSLGEVRVPDDVYCGAHTCRAVEPFPVSGRGLPPPLVHTLGLIKWGRRPRQCGTEVAGVWEGKRTRPAGAIIGAQAGTGQ